MNFRYRISRRQIRDTFKKLRECGNGQQECQILWVSPWHAPERISRIVHPLHQATATSFQVDERWLNEFWIKLAQEGLGIRAQIHTHPGRAFHSATDDEWPVVHVPGFLSIVIPEFAHGPISLKRAYIAELSSAGLWRQTSVRERLEVVR